MSRSLITRKTVYPGQPGSKKLHQQYGDDLVCVRYRYDAVRRERVKTVEIIVERGAWEPDRERIPPNKRIPIRVTPQENDLKQQVKAAGGRWNPKQRVWELAYKEVLALGLSDRIVRVAADDKIRQETS